MIQGTKAFVRDVLAPEGMKRTHEIVSSFLEDGRTPKGTKRYALDADTPVEMPLEHAMQFLKDVNFIVTGEDGKRIDPLPIQKDGGVGGLKLEPGETIAHLSELTTTSLFKRCKASAFSVGISAESSREDMIDFILSLGKKNIGAAQNVDVTAVIAAAGVQMSPKELASIFGD